MIVRGHFRSWVLHMSLKFFMFGFAMPGLVPSWIFYVLNQIRCLQSLLFLTAHLVTNTITNTTKMKEHNVYFSKMS